MKIKLYLMGYRSRWGDSGVTHHYDRREWVESLFPWLENEPKDLAEIRGMLNTGKDVGDIWDRIGEMLDSSGHEFYPQEIEIDPALAERVEQQPAVFKSYPVKIVTAIGPVPYRVGDRGVCAGTNSDASKLRILLGEGREAWIDSGWVRREGLE